MSYQTMEWADGSSGGTPINADNLNNMIEGIDEALLDITTGRIADSAVTNAKLASGAVTQAKLADSSVTGTKINNGAVTEDKLATDAVTGAKIKNGEVTAGKLGQGAITTDKISDNAVTSAKVASNAISTGHIHDDSVTKAKLSSAVQTILDRVPDTPMFIHSIQYVNGATALDSSTYCVLGAVHQFKVYSDIATILGLSAGTFCELRYYNNYQYIYVPSTRQVIAREVTAVAPTFTAGSWEEITDTENGTISSTATYPSGSEKTISGTYELNGDYCTITANAGVDSGENSMIYALPVAAVGTAVTIGVGGGFIGRIYILSGTSTLTVKDFDSSTFTLNSSTSFTIKYKYR